MTGDVYIDGNSLSQQQGHSEVFDWRLVNRQPLYFFRRGSETGLAYAGQVLPYRYEQVPHHLCCEPASLNPQGDESGVRFYGLRKGIWYAVDLAAVK